MQTVKANTYLHDGVLRLLLFLVQCLKNLHPHMPELSLPALAPPELALLFLITFRRRPLLSSGNLQNRHSGVTVVVTAAVVVGMGGLTRSRGRERENIHRCLGARAACVRGWVGYIYMKNEKSQGK